MMEVERSPGTGAQVEARMMRRIMGMEHQHNLGEMLYRARDLATQFPASESGKCTRLHATEQGGREYPIEGLWGGKGR